jgi:uncharacterized protein (DUF305 family)
LFSSLQDECGNFSSILDLGTLQESLKLVVGLSRSSGNANFSSDPEVVKQSHTLLEQKLLIFFAQMMILHHF